MTPDQQIASLLALLVLAVPGIMCVLLSGRRVRLSEGLIISSASTFGVFGIWPVVNRFIVIPYNQLTIGLLFSVSVSATGLAGWFQRTRDRTPARTPLEVWSVGALTIIASTWSWCRGTADRVVIGNHDAMIHSAFVGNIVAFESLAPSVTHSHPVSGTGTTNFYPLSFHAVASGLSKVFDISPSQVVYSLTAVGSIIILPIGIYLLASHLPGGSQRIGALSAACLLPLYLFPQGTLGWGGITMVYGIVLLFSFLGLALWAMARSTPTLILVCFASVVILATIHSSEVFLFFPLLLILGWQQLGNGPSRWLKSLVLSAAVLSMLYPVIERSLGFSLISSLAEVNPNESGTLYQAVGQILLLSPGLEKYSFWSLVFVLGGIVAIAYSRRMTQLLGAYAFLFIYAVIASQATKPWYQDVSHVLSPWYRQYQRMSYFLVPIVALMGGCFIDALSSRVTRPLSNYQRIRTATNGIVSLSCAAVMTITSISLTSSIQKLLFSGYSMHSAQTINPPFDQLGIATNDTILGSYDSGAGYWSIDHEMRVTGSPFMGTYLIPGHELLLDAVASLAGRQDVRDAYSSLSVDYIITNSRAMSGPPRPSAVDLTYSNSFDSIWNVDGYQIWRPREIMTDLNGPLTGWATAPDGQTVRWMTERDAVLSVFNAGPREKTVRVKLRVKQNACGLGTGVRLNDTEYVVRSLKHLSFKVRLPVRTQVNVPISALGESCIDPSTGALVYLGIAPVSIEPM